MFTEQRLTFLWVWKFLKIKKYTINGKQLFTVIEGRAQESTDLYLHLVLLLHRGGTLSNLSILVLKMVFSFIFKMGFCGFFLHNSCYTFKLYHPTYEPIHIHTREKATRYRSSLSLHMNVNLHCSDNFNFHKPYNSNQQTTHYFNTKISDLVLITDLKITT